MEDVTNTSADLWDGAASRGCAPTFDAERYRDHVAHLDMSEARKAELLQAVWQIMRSFVDRAFGDDSAQLARIAGDKRSVARETGLGSTPDSSHARNSGNRLAATFRRSDESDWKERGEANATK